MKANKPGIIIGSVAIKHHLPDFRSPNDVDVYVNEKDLELDVFREDVKMYGLSRYILNISNALKYEVKIVDRLDKAASDQVVMNDPCIESKEHLSVIGPVKYSSLELNMALKMASLAHSNEKHKEDIAFIESRVPDIYRRVEAAGLLPFVEQRTKEIEARKHNRKFFNKYKILRFVEHDSLHSLVSNSFNLGDRPKFESIVENGHEVSERLFMGISQQERINSVVEECLVLAFERNIFPVLYNHRNVEIHQIVKSLRFENYGRYNLLRMCHSPNVPPLKDHPDWLVRWCRENYRAISDRLVEVAMEYVASGQIDELLREVLVRVKRKTIIPLK